MAGGLPAVPLPLLPSGASGGVTAVPPLLARPGATSPLLGAYDVTPPPPAPEAEQLAAAEDAPESAAPQLRAAGAPAGPAATAAPRAASFVVGGLRTGSSGLSYALLAQLALVLGLAAYVLYPALRRLVEHRREA